MKVLNFGSLNLDYVYHVPHFVQPGETLQATSQMINCGGKGLNQSIALAKAGANVFHAGCIGSGGEVLRKELEDNGVNTKYLSNVDAIQGNAVIQVDANGENCILLFGGSNQQITREQVQDVLEQFEQGDYLVLQNEVNCLEDMIELASKRGMKVVLNPSPFDEKLRDIDYNQISWLLVNEVEAEQISGKKDPQAAWEYLHEKYPSLNLLVTLGSRGSVCFTGEEKIVQESRRVKAVDTTAAGDTFTGYFLASLLQNRPLKDCLEYATCASAISVTRPGASKSIPLANEVEEMVTVQS